MRTFASDGYSIVKGRGKAFSIPADQMPDDLWDPNQMTGSEVMIDLRPYTVKAVETFAIPRSPEHPYRQGFSLLVGEEPGHAHLS